VPCGSKSIDHVAVNVLVELDSHELFASGKMRSRARRAP
jgi:hypothetical protein